MVIDTRKFKVGTRVIVCISKLKRYWNGERFLASYPSGEATIIDVDMTPNYRGRDFKLDHQIKIQWESSNHSSGLESYWHWSEHLTVID